jgi:hypothetical protein
MPLSGIPVSSALHQDIEHNTLLIHCAPLPMLTKLQPNRIAYELRRETIASI